MTDEILRSGYTIQVTRKGNECVASIPELCIAGKGTTPLEALSVALQIEQATLKTIEDRGTHLPPAGGLIDPFPRVTRSVRRYFAFIAKIAVGYILVVCITAVLAAIAFPSVRSQAEQYLFSKDAATDAGKVFSRLGVSLCLQNP